ncbi:MAG: serine hydrolase, partial [Acidobacteriota bacterium]
MASKIYEVGEAEGKDFISMEYVQGTTLKEKLAEGPSSRIHQDDGIAGSAKQIKMKPNLSLVAGILLLLFASGTAQADKVDDYIENEMKKHQIPGLALAVVKDGKVKAKGYGLANVQLNVPVTPDTVFRLAS